MNFTDPQLQKCYDKNLAEASDSSGELREVSALMAMHEMFAMLEGPHSARVHETIEHLLSARMRPGLREWYQRFGADLDAAADEFRERLSHLIGERLESNPRAGSRQT